MSLDDLILAASKGPFNTADVERAAEQLGTSANDLFDRLARRIAEGYLSGDFDFGLCDASMNQVFLHAHAIAKSGLSPFAWAVFEALDQGEFRGEDVTRDLLADVLTRGHPKSGDGSP